MPLNLLSLPHEVLHNIIVQVDPGDVARLPRCCRTLNQYIKNNPLLFKEIYLTHFVGSSVVMLCDLDQSDNEARINPSASSTIWSWTGHMSFLNSSKRKGFLSLRMQTQR